MLDAFGSKAVGHPRLDGCRPMAILYAVSHPDRARAIVLFNAAARYLVADDFPIGYFQEVVDGVIELVRTFWGRPEFVAINNPAIAENEGRLDALARLYRSSTTPRASAAARLHIEERRTCAMSCRLFRSPPPFSTCVRTRFWMT